MTMAMNHFVMRVPKKKDGITLTSYSQIYWPQLNSTIITLLTNPNSPFSRDTLVNLVYRICTAGLMEQCYTDLKKTIRDHLYKISINLSSESENKFLQSLANAMSNYQNACEKICIIFHYLNRQNGKQRNLSDELKKELGDNIIRNESIHNKLKQLLPRTKPNTSPNIFKDSENIFLNPATLQQLIVCLYHFEPRYSIYNETLFSLYIPKLFPDKGLEIEKQKTREYLQSITNISQSSQNHKKRKFYQL